MPRDRCMLTKLEFENKTIKRIILTNKLKINFYVKNCKVINKKYSVLTIDTRNKQIYFSYLYGYFAKYILW